MREGCPASEARRASGHCIYLNVIPPRMVVELVRGAVRLHAEHEPRCLRRFELHATVRLTIRHATSARSARDQPQNQLAVSHAISGTCG